MNDNKVVLSLRGREAIQYVSNSELMRLGRQVVEKVQAGRQKEAEAEKPAKNAEASAQEHDSARQGEGDKQERETGQQQEDIEGQSCTSNAGRGTADDDGDGPHYDDGLSDEDLDIRFPELNVTC